MKPERKILLTFDYEPYLGARSGTAEKCLLEPTDALRGILNKHKATGIFFVDTLYLFNLQKHPELAPQLDQITMQLISLHKEGHYIFPHIHAHWLDAFYIEDKKEFSLTDLSRYSLANIPKEEARNLFHRSLAFLEGLGITYKKWGYRAGGWCIQPFGHFKEIFTGNNIQFEFSVLPGYKNENPSQAFDFTQVKQNTPYNFSDIIEKENSEGLFTEFPISTIQLSSLTRTKDRLVRKYLWKTGDKGWGNGTSAQTSLLKSGVADNEMISIELLTVAKLHAYKKYLKNNTYMHWISHPKMFTQHGLRMFESFLEFAGKNFKPVYDFQEMIPSAKRKL